MCSRKGRSESMKRPTKSCRHSVAAVVESLEPRWLLSPPAAKNLSESPRPEVEPAIAVDPTNPNNRFAIAMHQFGGPDPNIAGTPDFPLTTRTTDGVHWSRITFP